MVYSFQEIQAIELEFVHYLYENSGQHFLLEAIFFQQIFDQNLSLLKLNIRIVDFKRFKPMN